MSAPFLLSSDSIDFPDPNLSLLEPNGLLAIGGDLTPERIINAYKHGIFPWHSKGEPLLWWSPEPRAVLFLDELKISRSLKKTLRNKQYHVTFDKNFVSVIRACAGRGEDDVETWIHQEMIDAYCKLHEMNIAHSTEVWLADKLIGGLYGLMINNIFCGESMFSSMADASKVALVYLVEHLKLLGCKLIDCQIMNPHLASLGVREIPRRDFLQLLIAS